MAQAWKTVRIFISSTFHDMQAERDHLVRFVFPRLREELLPRRIHLVDMDMRWGVTSEQDVSEVCREIIDHCRPRFLCMLGGRYGWVPPGKTRSITADEVHYGVLDRKLNDRGFTYFYFRDDAATAAMVETIPGEFREPKDSDNHNKLAELKEAIIDAGLNLFTYAAQWDNDSKRLTGLKKFGDRVYDDLLGSMKSDPELRNRFMEEKAAQLDEFAEENAAMEAFVEERTERFVLGSREAVLEELLAHASATSGDGYLCLTGAPGSGKSALLAHLYRRLTDSSHPSSFNVPHSLVIGHFVGASPSSTDVRRTLRRLCHELKAGCADITAEIPDDPEKLSVAFLDFLRQACAKKHVVILLDAVNQFDPVSHSAGLHLLPLELPDNARVILSALDSPALEELRHRKMREIELQPLTAEDEKAIIEQFRKRYRKNFEPEQRAALVAKTDAGTPLYLLAALEELRTLGTNEEITRRIVELPPTTHELFAWILERLENDDGFRDAAGRRVGHELVSRFAALLGASRYGLSQRELTDLLAPGDSKVDPPIEPDPQGNVAALLHLLRPYLMLRGEMLDFYHGQLKAAVGGRYLSGEDERIIAHKTIADYFETRWRERYSHALSELPYHQTAGRKWKELENTLTDLLFIEAKCAAGMTYDLLLDYAVFQGIWVACPSESASDGMTTTAKDRVSAFHEFVLREAHNLVKFSAQLGFTVQQAFNSNAEGTVHSAASILLDKSRSPCILRTNRPFSTGGVSTTQVFEGYQSTVRSLCVARDGKLLAAAGGKEVNQMGEQPSDRQDNSIRVWDFQTGRLIGALQGHTSSVRFLKTVGSDHILSASTDGSIRLWNLNLLNCDWVAQGHSGGVLCLVVIGDKVAITGGSDHHVRLWDIQHRRIMAEVHLPNAIYLAIHPSGLVVSVSSPWDSCVRVWRLPTCELVREFNGHAPPIMSAAFVSDSQLAVAESRGSVRVWNMSTGMCERVLRCEDMGMEGLERAQTVNCISVLPPARLLGGGASGLHIWDLLTGEAICGVPSPGIYSILALEDGSFLSGGYDGRIRHWHVSPGNLQSGSGAREVRVRRIAWAGKTHLVGVSKDAVGVWNTLTGKCQGSARVEEGEINGIIACEGHEAISFSGDILLSQDRALRVWKVPEAHCVAVLEGHSHGIQSSTFIGKPGYIASGDSGGEIRLWCTRRLVCVGSLKGHKGGVCDMVATGDGMLVSASWDGEIRVWDLASAKCMRVIDGEIGGPLSLFLTTDKCLVARRHYLGMMKENKFVSGDERMIVWDLNRMRRRGMLSGHKGRMVGVELTNDNRLVSFGEDGTIRVWDLITCDCKRVVSLQCDAYSQMRMTHDQKLLFADRGGTLRVLDLETLRTIATVCLPQAIVFLSEVSPTGYFGAAMADGALAILVLKHFPPASARVSIYHDRRHDASLYQCPWCKRYLRLGNNFNSLATWDCTVCGNPIMGTRLITWDWANAEKKRHNWENQPELVVESRKYVGFYRLRRWMAHLLRRGVGGK